MTLAPRGLARIALLAVLAAVLAGCGNKNISLLPFTNQPPTVRITAAPIDTNAVCDPDPARSCYSLTLDWVGYDVDGRVDHFQYAVDPEFQDTTWIVTTDNERRLVFPAPDYHSSDRVLRGIHTFVIAAVDERGAIGPRVSRSFFSFTEAPRVEITNPSPRQDEITLPPSVRFSWIGFDDDGVFTTKPVRYRYLLLTENSTIPIDPGLGRSPSLNEIASNPSIVRTLYAPDFSTAQGWVQVGGDTTTVQFTGLIPSSHYLFIVVAFDEAGAFTPTPPVVRFAVGYAAAAGPTVTIFNEFFFFTFPRGYNPEPQFWVNIEVPAFRTITFNWDAVAPPGSDLLGGRWMVDGDIQDETPREDETDLKHWSALSNLDKSARIGPFNGGVHFFYLEYQVNTGLKTLCTIRMTAVAPTFAKDLLFVDDTRFTADQLSSDGSLKLFSSPWPSASEADTFFHAVGGKPWQKYSGNSPQGILHGYDYDTLNTRTGVSTIGVPLAILGQYKHVMWMTDLISAGYVKPGYDPTQAITALAYGATPGHLNTLAAYLSQGGEAWLCGSGGAYAVSAPFNVRSNDGTGGDAKFVALATVVGPFGLEIQPGRFMYDVAHWQSEYRCVRAAAGTIYRSLGRFASVPDYPTNSPSPPAPGTSYAAVPPVLEKRTAASDPFIGVWDKFRSSSTFYNASYPAEAVTLANDIREPVSGDVADFRLDDFEQPEADIQARWKTSDPVNTQVFRDAVPPQPPGARASGTAMKITSQGPASAGDRVRYTFNQVMDFSGARNIRVSIKQDQPTSAVQWKVRIIGDVINGGQAGSDTLRASALIPVATVNGFFNDVSIRIRDLVDEGSRPVRLTSIRAIEFELATSNATGTSWFDRLEVLTDPEGSALDTLMAISGQGFPAGAQQRNATMTVYHGHDLPKPFIMSGFAPYGFKRAQCQAICDFVFQNLWGLPKNPAKVTGPGSGNDLKGGRVISYPMVSTATPAPTPRTDAVPHSKGLARDTYRSGRTAHGAQVPNGGPRR